MLDLDVVIANALLQPSGEMTICRVHIYFGGMFSCISQGSGYYDVYETKKELELFSKPSMLPSEWQS